MITIKEKIFIATNIISDEKTDGKKNENYYIINMILYLKYKNYKKNK